MRLLRRLSTTVLALALLATLGLAQDRPVATIKLADGSSIQGNATKYDDTTQTLYFTKTDGTKLELKLTDLDGRSAYLLNRTNMPKDDGPGQLQLANFARDVGLYAHSKRHYDYALKADPSLKPDVDREVAVLKKEAAAYCMTNLKAAQAAGNTEEATRWAKILLQKLPDTPEATVAQQMMDDLYKASHEARDDKLESRSANLIAGELKKGKAYYDKMLEHNKKGLTTKSLSSSKREFNNAIKEGDRALKEIDKISKQKPDADTQATLDSYHELITKQMIDTYMNIASAEMTRSSYVEAQKQVNKALALDPNSETAQSMRSRIEMASSRGIGVWR